MWHSYSQFQISDGVGGNAEAEANAVFIGAHPLYLSPKSDPNISLDPFANVDLSTVSDETRDAIEAMRKAAENAETELFNPAIDSASGDEADALQVGKIKNKVLKLTGEVQVLNIKVRTTTTTPEEL